MQWKSLLITLRNHLFNAFSFWFSSILKKNDLRSKHKIFLFHAFQKFLKSRPKFIQTILIHVGIYKNKLQKKLKRI